jgi:hypothetical protein
MRSSALTPAPAGQRSPKHRPPGSRPPGSQAGGRGMPGGGMRGRRRPGRWTALALLLAAAAVLSAACSSGSGAQAGPGNSPVASLSGHGASPAGAGQPTSKAQLEAQSDQDMVNFARCMRAHGVQMSDPFHIPGHGLSINLPTRDSATSAAWGACNHFIAKIEQIKEAAGASWAAANLPALTRYAQCMRSHDIPMLDPTADGGLGLGNVPGITSDFGRYSPQFRAADQACRHLLPPSVHDDGTGP